ncbi:hypothetical protein NBO_15g0011 [Nosema bombycis CQ1]|uniref:PUM-HD domain-containing protein n=1 Tax=Nosema bombycis (strain CQ1 / CVCC 102059) TaxID=578461 RepID=R0MA06_NOSB1|nr:hypothetical protein NBO_15g0011 [Nosema bombycis CQ1]|eukprot:EOB14799.1 hypothetical protein NBO_15g0011 [Nosema bombycis CQ1]
MIYPLPFFKNFLLHFFSRYKMTEEKSNKIKNEEENSSMVFKTLKKVDKPIKGGKDKKLTESRDSLKLLRKYTREKNIDNTVLKRKIEMAWIFVRETFAKIASQRRNHKYLLMIYEKGSLEIKKEFLDVTLKEIVEVAYSEHGKGLVLYLYKSNESNKSRIIEAIRKNIRPLITNSCAIGLVDEIYNLNKGEKRGGAVASAYVEGCDIKEECVENDGKEDGNDKLNNEDDNAKEKDIKNGDNKSAKEDRKNGNEGNNAKEDNGKSIGDGDIKDANEDNNNATIYDNDLVNNIKFYKTIFPRPIFKLFDRKLLSFEIVHDILFHFFMKNKDKLSHFYGLMSRNKQFKYLPLTHKGLEVCIELIKRDEKNIPHYLDFINNDFVSIVNNKYGIVFILMIMEVNKPEYNKRIVEQYIKNFKSIFASEESMQPIIYLFNQEKKHFGTLFNKHRTKVMVEVDRSSFIDNFRKMVLENLEVFVSSFCYPIVFWLAKKDPETNKAIRKYFKGIEINNSFTEKLHKKLIKYKVIK